MPPVAVSEMAICIVLGDRLDCIRIVHRCQARLRELEEKLLSELNSVTGNILDNDTIIQSLESIKKETSEVAAEVRCGPYHCFAAMIVLALCACHHAFPPSGDEERDLCV